MREVVRSPISALKTDWRFRTSAARLGIRLKRLYYHFKYRLGPPAHTIMRAVTPHERWNLLFLYLPAATLDPAQREILRRVRQLSGKLLVVFAAETVVMPPDVEIADAIIHKALIGYDFSAYAIGLAAIAAGSPGANVYIQNDSVLGPFSDIDAFVERAPWDLTGFTGSATVENHISSFAFILKNVTAQRASALSPAMSTRWCYNDFDPVVLNQETRLARVASQKMSVGTFYFLPVRRQARRWRKFSHKINHRPDTSLAMDVSGDATLSFPLELIERGFPFIKRSLFGKFASTNNSSDLFDKLTKLLWPNCAL